MFLSALNGKVKEAVKKTCILSSKSWIKSWIIYLFPGNRKSEPASKPASADLRIVSEHLYLTRRRFGDPRMNFGKFGVRPHLIGKLMRNISTQPLFTYTPNTSSHR